jgi:hypothetical protein
MSAVVNTPLPTELKAKLVTWFVLLLVVLLSVILLWASVLVSFGAANLIVGRAFGRGFDESAQELFIAATGAACALAGAFAYFCLVRGTLRDEAR